MKSRIFSFFLILVLIGTTIFSFSLYNHKSEVKITLCDQVQEGMIFVTKFHGSFLDNNLSEDEPIDITKLEKLNLGDKIKITCAEGVHIYESVLVVGGTGFKIYGLASDDFGEVFGYKTVVDNIQISYMENAGIDPDNKE